MIRYYRCPVIGEGTNDEYEMPLAYRQARAKLQAWMALKVPPTPFDFALARLAAGTDPPTGLLTPAERDLLLNPPEPIRVLVGSLYRPALIDVVSGLNWATDIPNRSPTDGAPTFDACIVCVNTTPAKHALIAALPAVEDALDGLLTTEATRSELLTTLRSVRFGQLPGANQAAKRTRHVAQASAHPTNPITFTVRAALEDGDLERWMDGLLQQQRRSAQVANLFVSA